MPPHICHLACKKYVETQNNAKLSNFNYMASIYTLLPLFPHTSPSFLIFCTHNQSPKNNPITFNSKTSLHSLSQSHQIIHQIPAKIIHQILAIFVNYSYSKQTSYQLSRIYLHRISQIFKKFIGANQTQPYETQNH